MPIQWLDVDFAVRSSDFLGGFVKLLSMVSTESQTTWISILLRLLVEHRGSVDFRWQEDKAIVLQLVQCTRIIYHSGKPLTVPCRLWRITKCSTGSTGTDLLDFACARVEIQLRPITINSADLAILLWILYSANSDHSVTEPKIFIQISILNQNIACFGMFVIWQWNVLCSFCCCLHNWLHSKFN